MPSKERKQRAALKKKRVSVPQLTAKQMAFVEKVRAGQKPPDAAEASGYRRSQASSLINHPKIAAYLKEVHQAFVKEVAKEEAKRTISKAMGPTEVLARLSELAMLDPVLTKGNVTGQVAACQEMNKVYYGGYSKGKDADPLDGMTEEELEAVVRSGAAALGGAGGSTAIN